jgi:hypothetical protein
VVRVDGTVIATDDHATHRKANYNAKHCQTDMTVQILADLRQDLDTNVSSIRWAVEHAIAHLEAWKILVTGYRAGLTELPTLIPIVTVLEHYRKS